MSTESGSTVALHRDFCPYKGLQPYTEADRAYFFGRQRDREIIISNLYASQLTVFYGASGVGKSSVLLAGCVPQLKQERNLAVVVFRTWQDPGFLTHLKQCTLEAVEDTVGKRVAIDLSLPFDEFLEQATLAVRGPIFFVFDQFEEYFLYHPDTAHTEAFEVEFARAVNRRDVNVNFLLSMREDSLSKLDRFQGRIPTLLNNMLRLEHIDRKSARDAITKPLEQYNREIGSGQAPVTIDDELVDAVLNDLTNVRATSEQAGQGQVGELSKNGSEVPIETPFLQMILTRLWDDETASGSRVLRLRTYNGMGRAENIARTHLDSMMAKLTDSELKTAANIFRYLVTPSGTKIAQESGALASWSELNESDVQSLLNHLSAPDMRILRTVQAPGQPARYEIFHDVLGHAILYWRERYIQEQKRLSDEKQLAAERARAQEQLARQRKRTKRLRLITAGLALLTVLMVVLAAKAYLAKFTARARELAAYSRSQLETDPELSLLLAIQAVETRQNSKSIDALKAALLVSQLSAVLRPEGNASRIAEVSFSPDGKYVLTANWDNTARVWDAATGKIVSVLTGHSMPVNSAAFSGDGEYVVTGSLDRTARVWKEWKTNTPQVIATLTEPKEIWTTAFSPDGRYILTGGGDGKVLVWNWKNDPPGIEAQMPVSYATATAVAEPTPAPASDTSTTGQPVIEANPVASPDAAPSPSATASPTRVRAIQVYKAAFSPDGQYIIVAALDRRARVWRWGQELGADNPLKLSGHRFAIYNVSFSFDGKYVVTGSHDNTAIVWDLAVPDKPQVTINLLPNIVRGVAFSPDGRFVATASYDGLAKLWEWKTWDAELRKNQKLEDRSRVTVLRGHTSLLYSVAFSPDGKFVVTGSDDGTARLWRTDKLDRNALDSFTVDELLTLARSRVTRQLTAEEKAKYLDG